MVPDRMTASEVLAQFDDLPGLAKLLERLDVSEETDPEPDPDGADEDRGGHRVEHDRPVRLLGVRLEMTPPEEGYR